MKQQPIENDSQNYVTQTQYSKLRKALEDMEGNPGCLPTPIYDAQIAAIKSAMDEMRQAMEDYTRNQIDEGVIW